MQEPSWRNTLVGLVYVVGSVGLSLQFVFTLGRHTTNDFYWAHFNTTGMQSYLADLCNVQLPLLQAPTAIEFNRSMAIPKDYTGPNTLVSVSPARARSFLLQTMPLDQIVPSLQTSTVAANFKYMTPYCWVDFNHTFEMAHTAKRQQRCLLHDHDNAAVYLESILRNAKPQDIVKSSYFSDLNSTIFAALYESNAGREWMTFLQTHEVAPVAVEIATWRDAGLTKWIVQVNNANDQGLLETITVVNALGITSTITIGRVPIRARGGAAWTTANAYFGIWNDLAICSTYFGCSLVRGASNHFEAMGLDWDADVVAEEVPSPTTLLVRRYIGPFGSLDLRFVAVPPVLLNLVAEFQRQYYDELQRDATAREAYRAFVPVNVDPIPPAWNGLSFYGGNPLCAGHVTRAYPQETFGFYEACDNSVPYTIVLGSDSAVFALLAMGPLPRVNAKVEICGMCRTKQLDCHDALSMASTVQENIPGLSGFPPQQPALLSVLVTLNLTMIQFATTNHNTHDDDVFLTQPMVEGGALWDYFGWVSLYDWVQGTREVYMFEGDEGNVTLVSPYYARSEMSANPLEVPQSACLYVWYLSVYVTFVLSSVGALMIVFGSLIRFQTDPTQWFHFNRVVGSVWIGRPLLLVRGMAAATILSTANEQFIISHGFSQFTYNDRTLDDVLLLAGEALWITYVLVDICLPVTHGVSFLYAPLSSGLAWCTIAALEWTIPYKSETVLQPNNCTVQPTGQEVYCTSGSIAIGSWNRVVLICVVSAASVVVAYVVVKGCSTVSIDYHETKPSSKHVHCMVPGASHGHLLRATHEHRMDNVACIMSGMIPLMHDLFDVKLWAVMRKSTRTPVGFTFPTLGFKRHNQGALPGPPPPSHFVPRHQPHRRDAIMGLIYMGATVAGSYVYLALTDSTMANDMWWTTFNSTGTQLFLSSWFTLQLASTNALLPSSTRLDVPKYASTQRYNSSTASIAVPQLYATAILDEVNTLENVVRGLRAMDSCSLPWIFAAHCYVDFGHTWEMAPTAAKQQRCQNETDNAAVYLEPLLRNAHWPDLSRCWGDAIETSIFKALRTSVTGREWIAHTVQTMDDGIILAAAAEVRYWQSHGISSFTTQWQNFKILGVVESYSVRNAFGFSHPFTLKQLNSSVQLQSQTSYKLYSGLANTFTAVCTNGSSVAGRSLIRNANDFAFQNTTPEALLGTAFLHALVVPIGPALGSIRAMIGPFGSIDARRVACPNSLQLLYRTLTEDVAQGIVSNAPKLENTTALFKGQYYSPLSKMWSAQQLVGGNIMCESDPLSTNYGNDVSEFFTIHGRCDSTLLGTVRPSGPMQVMSIIASNLSSTTDPAPICEREKRYRDGCHLALTSLLPLVQYFPVHDIKDLVHAVVEDVRDNLRIALVQFVRQQANVNALDLSMSMLFAPTEPEFEFFAWFYLFEWAEQTREVVMFEGEHGRLTTMSGSVPPVAQTVNGMEIPVSVAFYTRLAIQYVTFMFLLVGCCVLCYIIAVRGYVEGRNFVKVNRVAGMVWVGRPLILLRGITAICLLSTPSLSLVQTPNGVASYFVSPPHFWLTTLMSSGEACWLVYILNDMCSPFTLNHTAYASKSSSLVWFVSFVLSVASPVQHEVSVARKCTVESVDFQLVCDAGTVYFGSVSRCLELVGIACVSCMLCYRIQRRIHTNQAEVESRKHTSPMLHAVAIHNLHFANWHYNGLSYIDKATAAMTGILSLRIGEMLYLFDIKSWRLHSIDTADTRDTSMDPFLFQAVPLMDGSRKNQGTSIILAFTTAMTQVFIVAAKRTPFGAFGGKLKSISATDLATHATKAALQAAKLDPALVDTVIVGNVAQTSSDAAYLARHVLLKSGIPLEKPALTINRLCGSGFQSLINGIHEIKLGEASIAVASGTENMSQAPLVSYGDKSRFGVGLGAGLQLQDSLWSALTDSYAKCPMGITAENLAAQVGVSREECDTVALRSQTLWAKAHAAGVFDAELAPIDVKVKGKFESFATDEHPRETTLEKLGKLKTVFKDGGVVTAGNASGIADGAGAIILASEAALKHAAPLARVVSYSVVGVDPSIMGIGPVPAIQQALKRANLTLDDMDLIEINEAFGAQYLSCLKELGANPEISNVNGGAIALGHPLGASGSRITAHLTHALIRTKKRYAVGAACIGGGQGIAIILENATL
ncbi:hypothetical protein B5M09_008198 [Aphanomyces astaci]|nr:hypothetical protein B5M09_008198 [Aphanomyces astaci]